MLDIPHTLKVSKSLVFLNLGFILAKRPRVSFDIKNINN